MPEDFEKSPVTGITKEVIEKVGQALTSLPEGFKALKQIEKVIEERKQIFAGEKPLNWSSGELLAYGSILTEGKTVG